MSQIQVRYIDTSRHSRFNKDHIADCDVCYDDYQDFLEQSRIDEIDDKLLDRESCND